MAIFNIKGRGKFFNGLANSCPVKTSDTDTRSLNLPCTTDWKILFRPSKYVASPSILSLLQSFRRIIICPSNNSEEKSNGTPMGQDDCPWLGTLRHGDTDELRVTINGRCGHVSTAGNVWASR